MQGYASSHKRRVYRREEREEARQSEGEVLGEGPLLTTGAAARLVGVHARTLERWASEGEIPADFVEDKRGTRYAVFRSTDIEHIAEVVRRKRQHRRG